MRMIPVRVLNLPRDIARLEWMNAHLGARTISYSVAEGIDGRAIPDSEAAKHNSTFRRGRGRDMTRGELGCALSHLRLIREIAVGTDPFICIMEDDIEISPDARTFLDEENLQSMPKFDVLRLYSDPHRQNKLAWQVGAVGGRSIVAPLRTGWGMYGQIFTRHGAAKLLDLKITGPIDGMIYYDGPPFGLRVLEVRPSLIKLHDFGSNTLGWRRDGFLQAKIIGPVRARSHFVATWGLQGLFGLLRAPYRASGSV
jgi:GR25 family glycosyltransferase involved in LPS biosynthesis